jgi:hypothetical protein
MLSKVQRDTRGDGPPKRLASGFAIRFFAGRVREMCQQLAEYEAALPARRPKLSCLEGDARDLSKLGVRGVDLFVSSPPYPGVLDYADYHRSRLGWLGLSGRRFAAGEIGARRSLQPLDHEAAAGRWEDDFSAVLAAVAGARAPGGKVALVLADALLAGRPYLADRMLERCAARAALAVLARGAQRRPHFHRQSEAAFGRRPRREHLTVLGRAAAPAGQRAPRAAPALSRSGPGRSGSGGAR